jgi:GT2 family glycosyltransferase
LNPDTELNATSLSAPLSLMESPENGKIAICGIQMVDKDGSPAPSVSVFPTPARFLCKAIGLSTLFPVKCASVLLPAGYPANSGVVDQVIGAFMLVRRRVFEELSGFDERFFVYHEDVDISLRAKKAGYESFFLREACAFHRGHGSSENVKAARLFYVLRGRILYSAKHFSSAGHALTVFLTLAIEPVSRLAKAAASLSLAGIRQTLSGYIKLYCWLLSRHRGSRSA